MPSYLFGDYFNTLVSVHFPGSKLGWTRAGCDVVMVPVPGEKDIVYVLVPKEAAAELDLGPFKKAVDEACEKKFVRVRWVEDDLFEGRTPVQVKMELMATIVLMAGLGLDATVSIHRPVLMVVLPSGSKEQMEMVLDALSKSHLRRVVVVGSVGSIEREFEEKAEANSRPVIEPHNGLNRPIGTSEVADVAILLETSKSVDEFLERM